MESVVFVFVPALQATTTGLYHVNMELGPRAYRSFGKRFESEMKRIGYGFGHFAHRQRDVGDALRPRLCGGFFDSRHDTCYQSQLVHGTSIPAQHVPRIVARATDADDGYLHAENGQQPSR